MLRVTRKIEFDTGHRVVGHQSKCQYLHGHRYVLEITVESDGLNDLGMVVDFGEIKSLVKTWVDKFWDHNVVLSIEDVQLGSFIESYTKQKIYYMDSNPTAENMALHLKNDILPNLFLGKSFKCVLVKLYETPNCYAESM